MTRILVCLLLTVSFVFAGAPVAKFTSAGPFRLSGTNVPTAGIPNWPLVAGDEIVMSNKPGEAVFADGTRMVVMANSRITIGTSGKRTLVRLVEGGVAYKFSKDSKVDLRAPSDRRPPNDSTSGRLYAVDGDAYWNPRSAMFYLLDESGPRLVSEDDFRSDRLDPYNLGLVDEWRNYNPEWGNAPGQINPPGEDPGTPGFDPPELRPVSPWR